MAQASGIPGLDDRLNRIFQMIFSDNENERGNAARLLSEHVRRVGVAPGDLQIVTGGSFGEMIAELRSRQSTIDRLRSEVLTLRRPAARPQPGKTKTVTLPEGEWSVLLDRIHPKPHRRAKEIAGLLGISEGRARRMVKSRTLTPIHLGVLRGARPFAERHPTPEPAPPSDGAEDMSRKRRPRRRAAHRGLDGNDLRQESRPEAVPAAGGAAL